MIRCFAELGLRDMYAPYWPYSAAAARRALPCLGLFYVIYVMLGIPMLCYVICVNNPENNPLLDLLIAMTSRY